MLEADYPYTAKNGRSCKYEKSQGVGNVASFKDVQHMSVSQLKAALNIAPVSIAIDADKRVFQMYHSGVISGSSCGTKLPRCPRCWIRNPKDRTSSSSRTPGAHLGETTDTS